MDENLSDLLEPVAVLYESSLETDAIMTVMSPASIFHGNNIADILARVGGNLSLFGVQRARRCRANVTIKKGEKVVVS